MRTHTYGDKASDNNFYFLHKQGEIIFSILPWLETTVSSPNFVSRHVAVVNMIAL